MGIFIQGKKNPNDLKSVENVYGKNGAQFFTQCANVLQLFWTSDIACPQSSITHKSNTNIVNSTSSIADDVCKFSELFLLHEYMEEGKLHVDNE